MPIRGSTQPTRGLLVISRRRQLTALQKMDTV